MNPKDLPGPGEHLTFRSAVNMAGFAAICVATTVTPFIRRRFGPEGLGFNGFFAFVIVCFVAGAAGPSGSWYFVAWFAFLILNRIITVTRQLSGIVVHSHYSGDPWLTRLICRNDTVGKWLIEPIVVAGTGLAIERFNVVLGDWFVVCAVALVLVQATEWRLTRMRIQAMHNAEIEMRYYTELYRQGR